MPLGTNCPATLLLLDFHVSLAPSPRRSQRSDLLVSRSSAEAILNSSEAIGASHMPSAPAIPIST